MRHIVSALVAFFLVVSASRVSGQDLSLVVTDSSLPEPLQHHSAVYDGQGTIYVIGGVLPGVAYRDQVIKYTLGSGAVEVVGTFLPLAWGAAAMHGEDIIFIGGYGPEGRVAGVYRFSTLTGVTTHVRDFPIVLADMGATWDPDEQCMYIFGGQTNEEGLEPLLDDIFRYNATSDYVDVVGRLPSARRNTAAVWTERNRVAILFGGWDETPDAYPVLTFDPETGIGLLPESTLPSTSHRAVFSDAHGKGYIVGLQEELLVFDASTSSIAPELVAGWMPVTFAAVVYVAPFRRIYILGGSLDGGTTGQISYIELGPPPTSTTTTPTTTTPTTTTPTTTTPTTTTPTTTTPTTTTPTTTTPTTTTPTTTTPTTTTTTPRPGPFECPDNEEAFYPDPLRCDAYYFCFSGFPFPFECPDDLWFNPDLNRCDYPENVECDAAAARGIH